MDIYYSKYLKYKKKYLDLKNKLGGSNVPESPNPNFEATQSHYYMVIIAEAFYIANGQAVPQGVINARGRITGLNQNGNQLITPAVYNQMVQDLVAHLGNNNNLATLQAQYDADTPPNNNVGHIDGNDQEALLGAVTVNTPHPIFGAGASILTFLETAINQHFGRG